MTTVSRYNPPVGEEEVEDGITSLQRKMLYALIVARYVPVPREADSGYSIAKALGFNPALTREVGENLKVLVGLGLVKETSIIAPSPDYNNIPVRAPVGYAPVYDASAGLSVPRVAEGRPVVAWLCLYGSLAFEENRNPDGTRRYFSKIASAMHAPESETSKLIDDLDDAARTGLVAVCVSEQKRPTQWRGSQGQMVDVMVNDVRVELI